MLGTVLSAYYTSSHLILTTTLTGRNIIHPILQITKLRPSEEALSLLTHLIFRVAHQIRVNLYF